MIFIFTGFQYSGKTTLGRLWAKTRKCPFYDTDDWLTLAYHQQYQQVLSVRDIYQKMGEVSFRKWEAKTIGGYPVNNPSVIALGGGSLFMKKTRDYLARLGQMLYLKLPPTVLYDRIKQHLTPAFMRESCLLRDFIRLYQSRAPIYLKTAHITLDVKNLTPLEILQQLKTIDPEGQFC